MKNITKQQKGFTIIEVLIVLAIAGLILLIVFLAVPALQRNSRNTQRKNDVGRILSGVVEAENNSNWPTGLPAIVAILGGIQNSGDLSIYNAQLDPGGDIKLGGATSSADGNVDKVVLVINAKCNGTNAVATQPRAVALLYRVETGGGGSQPQCQDS